jgi:hypothetical protein
MNAPSELAARILLSGLPLEERISDVCHGCGQHMLGPSQRIAWIRSGGIIHCQGCGIQKTRVGST